MLVSWPTADVVPIGANADPRQRKPVPSLRRLLTVRGGVARDVALRQAPGDGSRVAARIDRARARPARGRLVRAQRARGALAPRAGALRHLRVRGCVRGRAGLPAAGDQPQRPRAGRADGDVPLGGRSGGLPRARRGGAAHRRGRGAPAAAVGSSCTVLRERSTRSSGPATGTAWCSQSAPATARPGRTGAATAWTRPRCATAPASSRRRPTRTRRTRDSPRREPTRYREGWLPE